MTVPGDLRKYFRRKINYTFVKVEGSRQKAWEAGDDFKKLGFEVK